MAPRSLSRPSRRPHRCGRRRRCLLKGCGQWFQRTHPQCRYCSAGCREAARRWRRWHAQQKYRSSRHGREHRQQQARRYRQRRRNRPPPVATATTPSDRAAVALDGQPTAREGKRPAEKPEKVRLCPCDRPGCYELFVVGTASSPRRFCCVWCRNALRCVLEREARWRQRRRRGLKPAGRRPRRQPRGP
jgi:hypothetical protein